MASCLAVMCYKDRCGEAASTAEESNYEIPGSNAATSTACCGEASHELTE